MIGWSQIPGSDRIVKCRSFSLCLGRGLAFELDLAYPWADLPVDATICDIGGGKGHVMLQLLREYPHLRAVVQDLKPVIEDARKVSSYSHH